MTGQAIQVVAAIIERDGAVFAARRNADRAAGGLWEFPGGKVESDESPQQALRRELREELSVVATIGEFVDRSSVEVTGGLLEMSCYIATFSGPDPETSTDHDAMTWVDLRQLGTLAWAPADVPIIERLAENRLFAQPKPSSMAPENAHPKGARNPIPKRDAH